MKLTAGFTGNGHGRITPTPSGIDCDTSKNQTQCSHSFDTATWINLIATPAADSQFIRWFGNRSDCEDGEIFITDPTGCVAQFELLHFPLTITTTGQGKVKSEPVGINCSQCAHEFDIGTKVMLTAVPKTGWQFKEWQGDCAGTSPEITVTIDKAKTCTSAFNLIPSNFFYANKKVIPVSVESSQLGVLLKENAQPNLRIENFTQNTNMTLLNKVNESMVILRLLEIESRSEVAQRFSLAQRAREFQQQNRELVAQAGLVIVLTLPNKLAAEPPTMIMSDEFIAHFKPEVNESQISAFNQQYAVEIVMENPFLKNQFLLKITEKTPATALEIANLYEESGLTEYAHPNFVQVLEPQSIPNDPLFVKQWHHNNTGQNGGTVDADIDAPEAWELTQGNSNVVIATIDDGFDMSHPDLVLNYWTNPGEIVMRWLTLNYQKRLSVNPKFLRRFVLSTVLSTKFVMPKVIPFITSQLVRMLVFLTVSWWVRLIIKAGYPI
jgi:uncharacterized repeat protein (TIGR02543 family)